MFSEIEDSSAFRTFNLNAWSASQAATTCFLQHTKTISMSISISIICVVPNTKETVVRKILEGRKRNYAKNENLVLLQATHTRTLFLANRQTNTHSFVQKLHTNTHTQLNAGMKFYCVVQRTSLALCNYIT